MKMPNQADQPVANAALTLIDGLTLSDPRFPRRYVVNDERISLARDEMVERLRTAARPASVGLRGASDTVANVILTVARRALMDLIDDFEGSVANSLVSPTSDWRDKVRFELVVPSSELMLTLPEMDDFLRSVFFPDHVFQVGESPSNSTETPRQLVTLKASRSDSVSQDGHEQEMSP